MCVYVSMYFGAVDFSEDQYVHGIVPFIFSGKIIHLLYRFIQNYNSRALCISKEEEEEDYVYSESLLTVIRERERVKY